ncbi:acyl-CoA thioesterase [Effusibacillus lacus]|uniref:Thioesterase n=1 Tax=Effusibacillus lacus TaxID=1348429 RepID=A0A292YL37_9BACL|nr:thioesterase family protein [Effusibacillus lacus]TCS73636.1 acyl-CoA thioester hydrolase [Effusibacillus lacus]GAX89473.1 thioesterase [Effusibacillus lacus]
MESKWHEIELRVRYSETDAMQVVYHANYLNWFEIGRTEMMRNTGAPYRELEEAGILLPVIEARAFYHSPARYDDLIIIRTRLTEARVKVKFEYEIVRQSDAQLLVNGYTVHAWVNRDMKPIQLRKAAPEIYNAILGFLTEN